MVERLLTLAEVAELLRLSEGSLYRQRYVGQPPGSLGFRVGRYVRFSPSRLEGWLDNQAGRDGNEESF